jgi:hypothetical protein
MFNAKQTSNGGRFAQRAVGERSDAAAVRPAAEVPNPELAERPPSCPLH